MYTIRVLALAALLPIAGAAFAEDVKPGQAPTSNVGDAVPKMKGGCADKDMADKKATGTEATKAVGEAVPTMTADATDCLKDAETEKMDDDAKK